MKTHLLTLISVIILFISENSKAQITYLWRGGSSGSWETPGNWSVGGVTQTILYPGSSATTNDIAQINTSNTTITSSISHTIGQLKSTSYGVSGITINFSGSPTLIVNNGFSMAQPASQTTVLTFSGAGTVNLYATSSLAYYGSMVIASGATVNFESGSTLDFTANQGTLTNNGTLNFISSTLKLGYAAVLVSPGSIVASNSSFNISSSAAYITYGGKFVSNSCTFTMPSGSYVKTTSTSAAFTSTTSTFNMSGSGGSAYFYNSGNYRDHGSTYNLTGQSAYLQNVSNSIMHFSGTTINFSSSGGGNNQYINNAGTFTADSATAINATTYTCYITNSGTFYAGTSGSACVITLSGQSAVVTNTGTFNLGSTSIIYPSGSTAAVTNTSPGVFTIQSDANGSGAIGALSATAACNGTFNVQRYFQGSAIYDNTKKRWLGRNYRIISEAVNTGTKVNSNYVSGLNYIVGTTAGQTTAANSLTNAFITGCTGGSTGGGNPSAYLYNQSFTPANATFTDGDFLGITNITNSTSSGTLTASDGGSYSLPIGNGVFFFFRGAATNWSARTTYPYIAPENVTLTATGNINQQTVTVHTWFSPTLSTLGYTGSGMSGNYNVRGFNMVGNPYPSTIDWCTAYSGTGITRTNVGPTIYEYNPVTNQYDTYQATSSSGGTGTGSATRYIASGQGFFVLAGTTGASLTFTEAAKAPASQLTGSNLLMGTPVLQAESTRLMRLKLTIDSLNYDDIAIKFNAAGSVNYNENEDARFLAGNNAKLGLSSFSADSVKLSINCLPLPKLSPQVIRLNVDAQVTGSYTFNQTQLTAIPQLYEIWLMDHLKKDSLDIRNNTTYKFDVDISDTTTYGSNRFQLVIRQNPALMVHLLSFTGTKATDGAQLTWKTENEQNYTDFSLERSSDGGSDFNVVGGFASSGSNTYSLTDVNPPVATDIYRLKITDINGTITYSNTVTLIYTANGNLALSNISVYPNPAGNTINLAIHQTNAAATQGVSALQAFELTPALTNNLTASYNIKIINITGMVVKTAASARADWQDSISDLLPGTYVIQVVNNSNNSVVGKSTFVKL